jgi:hypothetical protein
MGFKPPRAALFPQSIDSTMLSARCETALDEGHGFIRAVKAGLMRAKVSV